MSFSVPVDFGSCPLLSSSTPPRVDDSSCTAAVPPSDDARAAAAAVVKSRLLLWRLEGLAALVSAAAAAADVCSRPTLLFPSGEEATPTTTAGCRFGEGDKRVDLRNGEAAAVSTPCFSPFTIPPLPPPPPLTVCLSCTFRRRRPPPPPSMSLASTPPPSICTPSREPDAVIVAVCRGEEVFLAGAPTVVLRSPLSSFADSNAAGATTSASAEEDIVATERCRCDFRRLGEEERFWGCR